MSEEEIGKKMNIRNELVVALIGAIVGAAVALVFDSWSDSKERLNEANIKNIIAESKSDTLEAVRSMLVEVGEQRAEMNSLRSRAEEDSDYLALKRQETDAIIKQLKEKTNLSDADILRVFDATIKKEIDKRVTAKTAGLNLVPKGGIILLGTKYSCPKGTTQIAVSSIQIAKKDKAQYKKSLDLSAHTDHDVSRNYDGRLFKTCVYN